MNKIYRKKLRNQYQFPIVSQDALILKQSEEANYEQYSLNLFKTYLESQGDDHGKDPDHCF